MGIGLLVVVSDEVCPSSAVPVAPPVHRCRVCRPLSRCPLGPLSPSESRSSGPREDRVHVEPCPGELSLVVDNEPASAAAIPTGPPTTVSKVMADDNVVGAESVAIAPLCAIAGRCEVGNCLVR